MSARARKAANDPSRFEGDGVIYRAKLIGIEDVREARGDQMCQEALGRLKNAARIAGGHKRKILVNVTLEGLKIQDAISLVVVHTHAVNRISFISRDPTDSRAFGYIYETEDGLHKFFAIKTATAAEQLVLALKDLFQVVFELKKKELDGAKEKPEKEEVSGSVDKETTQAAGDSISFVEGQTPTFTNADAENNNQVTSNTAPVSSDVARKPVANLLDFEDLAGSIKKEIEQIKNLELDFLSTDITSSASPTPASPVAQTSPPTTTVDPWGLSTTETSTSPAVTSSALGDLDGLQAGPFSTSFPMLSGFGGSAGFNTMTGGLSAIKDPFGSDPFSPFTKPATGVTAAGSQQASVPSATGFVATNPFGSEVNQPFGMQGIPPRMGVMGNYGMMPGMVPHGTMSPPALGGVHNPFAAKQSVGFQMGNPFGESDSNLQTAKKEIGQDSNSSRSKSPHNDLFGDLVDMKKSSPTRAMSPKDMFVQINTAEKKSMNKMITSASSPRASPVPAMQLLPGTSPRASPVPTMQLLPGTSPRASPVPAVQILPATSPRASPVPTMQLLPGASPRASPVPTMQLLPGISPRASPVPGTQTLLTQGSLFDDAFGAPAQQSSAFDDVFGSAAQQSSTFDDAFGSPAQQISDMSLLD